ncbi:dihydrolipoyllysine-residue acetyltransferase [Aestuariirhabdus litorea]|uniref:Acetyltransferase component of pyruvate dehydrogenase complex n=1 Tax=Aestuariirhabdus litorea TaxID=2528527 RepID=A0A3P3VJ34_9GAMM|nr:dihydrolipoyllysine-residue acetyltransferase [Aestuariirhabdus litorea]RRJ82364.1 dihydrolipoyllysine-residue acetyltransferase [Aestuariirhabdus litorea]RWW92527.1 dihydrolipoyllysine-residue acetyltransferase [Endozoicomonadaceae bacterium GTF-13]
MSDEIIKVPDLGGDGEIIEISVQVGDQIEAEDAIMVVESDKASMEVPAPRAGTVTEILVKVGDTASEGVPMIKLSSEGDVAASDDKETATEEPAAEKEQEKEPAPEPAEAAPASSSEKLVKVPDLGGDGEVIEVCVQVGDKLEAEDAIVVVESDKASMEVPAPFAGTVTEILIKLGDTATEGVPLVKLMTQEAAPKASAPAAAPQPQSSEPKAAPEAAPAQAPVDSGIITTRNKKVHAGPAVRRIAREFGVDLAEVKGSGPRARILKEDVQAFVKKRLQQPAAAPTAATGGSGIPAVPAIDFSKFGPIKEVAMSRLQQVGAANLHRSWLNVPHVTQFDEADITEMEAFRKAQKAQGISMTPLPFIIKACTTALRRMPQFNASLNPDGTALIYKEYCHIGFAVDTPDGLLVPVIRDADKKGLKELAEEMSVLAGKAQQKKLSPAEMQGACFTISSLGSVGGTAFTPIVNTPEVAILGVSKASIKPVWDGNAFQPRLMLPLSLSYDHRAINGADAARFTTLLSALMGDIRTLLL